MGILYDIGQWRQARPIAREVSIRGPGRRHTFVWSLMGEPDEVAVIEKLENGKFLDFRVEKGKSFGRVVGCIKRRYTLQRRQGLQ